MRNPLTRGKGVKSIKIIKSLMGVPSFWTIIGTSASCRKHFYPFSYHSPERGLGQVIVHRTPRRGEISYKLEFPPSILCSSSGYISSFLMVLPMFFN
jgi:hypothetical protein